ncbi:N-6 DNA methylase, partial [Mycobacterium tuberculosis]|nr:N-6 DNA methylase [Mycobacterium tuberculosis]
QDPSKGLHFVEWVARQVTGQGKDEIIKNKTAKIAVLLPMQAAIGNSKETKLLKRKLLDKYTLEAVFSLPDEIFYPGASAVACCMIFDLSQNHAKSDKTRQKDFTLLNG